MVLCRGFTHCNLVNSQGRVRCLLLSLDVNSAYPAWDGPRNSILFLFCFVFFVCLVLLLFFVKDVAY